MTYVDKQSVIDIIEGRQKALCPAGLFSRHQVYGDDRRKFDDWQEIIDAVELLPEEEENPVRHAYWVKPTGMMPPEYHGHYECSLCGEWAGRDWLRPWKPPVLSRYCPGCGAVMQEENDVAD